ncbi:MAG: hypothetical protein ACWA6U_13830 [Breznakibacter sp.]
MQYSKLLVIIGFLCLISCNKGGQKQRKPLSLKSDSIKKVDRFTSYYHDGKIKEEGVYNDSIKVGLWREWYNDGDLKWSGYYDIDNERKINISQQKPLLLFLEETGKLKINTCYTAKVKVNGLHPKDILLSTKNKVSMTFNHNSDYFSFTFKNEGAVTIKVYAVYFSEDYYVGEIPLTIIN